MQIDKVAHDITFSGRKDSWCLYRPRFALKENDSDFAGIGRPSLEQGGGNAENQCENEHGAFSPVREHWAELREAEQRIGIGIGRE